MRKVEIWVLSCVVAAAGERFLECECVDLAEEKHIAQFDDGGPNDGKWFVQLQHCDGASRVGPYETRQAAARDVPRLRAEVDFCIDRLALGFEKEEPVPYADYVALKVDLEIAHLKIDELEHDIVELKADNTLLVEQFGLVEFQERILEYLQHASGSDDFLHR